MADAADRDACFRIATTASRAVAERVRARVSERLARGILAPDEVERLAAMRLRTVSGDGAVSEAFRRCCIVWQVDRAGPITSHRPMAGALIVAAKKVVGRALRFQNEAFLARQREFNWNLLVVMRDLLERVERDRSR